MSLWRRLDPHRRFEQCHAFALSVLLSVAPFEAQAQPPGILPSGGQVVSGSVAIGTPSNNGLTIVQSSASAIINWNAFSVGAPNTVTFQQPGASSAILNRVTGDTSSTIAGTIAANGQVYLINPNGIALTPSGAVQVGGGFVASTLGISDGDFNAGKRSFSGAGASAGVDNAGAIRVGAGGYVALLGGTVANSGVISAPLGKVGLGSGETVTLDLSGDGFMQVAVPTANTGDARPLVDNSGRINAGGGLVQLQAATVKSLIRDAVNVSGSIDARSVSGHSGAVVLGGGDGGNVTVGGRINVSAPAPRRAQAAPAPLRAGTISRSGRRQPASPLRRCLRGMRTVRAVALL